MMNLHGGQQQIAETFVQSKPALVTGAMGAGAAVTPTEQLAKVVPGDWLLTNGLGVLSYAEIIQVIGAVWVVCLLIDRVWALGKLLLKK